MAETQSVSSLSTGGQQLELNPPGEAAVGLTQRRKSIEYKLGRIFDRITNESLTKAKSLCAQDAACHLVKYGERDDQGYCGTAIYQCPNGTEQCARFATFAAQHAEDGVAEVTQNLEQAIVQEIARLSS